MSIRYSLLFSLIVSACACGKPAPQEPAAAAARGDALVIAEATQAVRGPWLIGVSNVMKGEYADAAGPKKKGLVAWLSINDPSDPSKRKEFAIHPGKRAEVGRESFVVEEIAGGVRGSVTLRFEPPAGR